MTFYTPTMTFYNSNKTFYNPTMTFHNLREIIVYMPKKPLFHKKYPRNRMILPLNYDFL